MADAVQGAQLLQRFVGKNPWAHLDITYTGMLALKETPTQPTGRRGSVFGCPISAANYEA